MRYINNLRNIRLFLSLSLSCFIISCGGNSNPPTPTPTLNPGSGTTTPPLESDNQSPVESEPSTPENLCSESAANFNYQMTQSLYNSDTTGGSWGPMPNTMLQEDWVNQCSKNSLSWSEKRTINSADYWVRQKVDYCHHHVPNWFPPAIYQRYLYCADTENDAPMLNIYPGSSTYQQNIRWNYDGITQTSADWQSTGQWYGVDCSNYTALVYNWAFGIRFSTAVNIQGGQNDNSNSYPNQANFTDKNVKDDAGYGPAGNMVCVDGSTAPLPTTSSGCNGHGGFISVFDSNGKWNSNAITTDILNNLQPGDMLYLATGAPNSTVIEHVVIWTGQVIGGGVIESSQIAPEQFCIGSDPNSPIWSYQNNQGNWIIVDSTYQGPDYRAFTKCFYRQNIWGVRRVL